VSAGGRIPSRSTLRWILVAAVLVACTACRTLVYHEPEGFEGRKWGEPIQNFEGLEFIAGDEVSLIECRGLLPMQVTAYYKPKETFAFPGTKTASVQYLFCYSGVSAEFCGVAVTYLSEEYDILYNGLQPTQDTNHRRFVNEEVKKYGRPHSGKPPKVAITLESVDGSWADMPLVPPPKYEHYTWCAPADANAPRGCRVSIVSRFYPNNGEGWELIATGPLRQFAELFQRFYALPYRLYEDLKDVERFAGDETPTPTTCRGKASRDRQQRAVPSGGESATEAAASAPVTAAADTPSSTNYAVYDNEFFSERILDEDALRHHTVREVPTHGLTADEFSGGKYRAEQGYYEKESEEAAGALRRKPDGKRDVGRQFKLSRRTPPVHEAYWSGYERGIETQFLLHRFWKEDSDARFTKAIESKNPVIHESGRGYRDGLQGLPHEFEDAVATHESPSDPE
jgi:hypothetical protein